MIEATAIKRLYSSKKILWSMVFIGREYRSGGFGYFPCQKGKRVRALYPS